MVHLILVSITLAYNSVVIIQHGANTVTVCRVCDIAVTDRHRTNSKLDRAGLFGSTGQCLQLIDFGQAIDMSLYPANTNFLAKVSTSSFQCIEMMTDRPWTFQVRGLVDVLGKKECDYFGQSRPSYFQVR